MAITTYTPSAAAAQYNAFAGTAFDDPKAYITQQNKRVDAKYFLYPIQNEVLNLIQRQLAGGGAIQVRNSSGGTLNAGPVSVSGYYALDGVTGNPIFTIVAADAAGNSKPTHALLLASLNNNTTGVAYLGGNFTGNIDLSGGSVGDPVYVAAGGGITRTAPSGVDQYVQIIGRIQTNVNNGVISGHVELPTKIGTSWHQPGTSAQILMSNATPAATWTTMSGDATITSAGVVTNSKINGNSFPSGVVTGDLFYGSAANAISRLADVAAGSYLRSGGVSTAPVWSSITLPNSLTQGDIWYGGGSGGMTALADVATGNALISGGVGAAPSWGKIGLTTHVSGILPIANGGTNNDGTVNLASGGSCYYDGTRILATVGSAGQLVMFNATPAVAFTTMGGDATISSTGSVTVAKVNGNSFPSGATTGDLFYGSGASAISRLAIGTQGKVLQAGSSIPQWGYPLTYKTVTFSSNAYTVLTTDGQSLIGVTAGSTSDQTVTLPAAATAGAGFVVAFQKVDSGTKLLVITPNAADTINGASSSNPVKLTAQYAYICLLSTGSGNSWIVVECCGDYVEAFGTTAAATGSISNVAGAPALTLSPGEWDISATVDFVFGSATTFTVAIAGISQTSATFGGGSRGGFTNGNGENTVWAFPPTSTTLHTTVSVPSWRVSLTAPQNIYLVAQMNFTGTSPTLSGRISARRIR